MATKCPKCRSENPDTVKFCGDCGTRLSLHEGVSVSVTKTLISPTAEGTFIAGRYRILDKLGEGGMGVVYKAEDTRLKRTVALKFMPPELTRDPEAKERFIREAQAAAALSHPNICTIHEVDEEDGQSFISMEYVEGQSVRERTKKGPLDVAEALGIAIQAAQGLEEAHKKGIVHRDIKSANIMVTGSGQAKVMDFGLAKVFGASLITKEAKTMGTVAYMSPEQAQGQSVDPRTDVWSLGVVLYEMLTGGLPFKGDHDQTVIHSILHGEPKPPSKLQPGLPSGLDEVVLRALAKKTTDRYQTMEEFRGDLEAVAEGLRPLKAKRRARRIVFGIRTAYVISALAILLALLLGLDFGGLRARLLGRVSGAAPAIRLAVLPFANLSGDPEQEYLTDGLTDEIIAQLGRLNPRSLGVIGRTSVMRFKKSDTPIDKIGRELGVGYVLEGSARKEENRVHITAKLIQVRSQTQLWADSFEREMAGVLALQCEVSRQVAGALAIELLPAEQVRIANTRTVDPEAYEAYLKGTYYRQFLTRDTLEAAEQYYRLALQKDPNYAKPWAGIARIWNGRGLMGIVPMREAISESKAACLKALELDGTEWEAHRALAGSLTWGDWDWPAAERKWDELIALNPNDPEVLQGYSHFLMHMGRRKEAIAEIQRAMELDPLSVRNLSFYATDLIYARRYDDAINTARSALRLQPGAPVARNALIQALVLKGKSDEALALDREQFAGDRGLMEALERGSAEAGYAGAQRRMVDVWTARYGKEGGLRAWDLTLRCLYAGDKERALEWLERAYEDRDGNMPYIGMPLFDSLSSDTRYQNLLRKMNLPVDEKE